jgi:type 1 glutamine amidotransferase
LKPRKEDGREIPGSTYKHGVDFKVQIADPQHPVTRGLTDFNIHDETYGKLEVFSDVKPLLTTDEPTSTRTIGWTRQEGTARVVYIQLGHDHLAYENPAYVRLIAQAIQWAAKRD